MTPEVIVGRNSTLFLSTFASSFFSACLGITKVLMQGPCRILPNNGLLGGYGNLGFVLAFFNVAATLVAKLLTVTSIRPNVLGMEMTGTDKDRAIAWFLIFVVPQVLFVSYVTLTCVNPLNTVSYQFYLNLVSGHPYPSSGCGTTKSFEDCLELSSSHFDVSFYFLDCRSSCQA